MNQIICRLGIKPGEKSLYCIDGDLVRFSDSPQQSEASKIVSSSKKIISHNDSAGMKDTSSNFSLSIYKQWIIITGIGHLVENEQEHYPFFYISRDKNIQKILNGLDSYCSAVNLVPNPADKIALKNRYRFFITLVILCLIIFLVCLVLF